MSESYPLGPEKIPQGLTRLKRSYKIYAWLAVLGLSFFVIIYLMLTIWFGWTAYRLIISGFETGGNVALGIATGLPAMFLTIFMAKALFFIKRGQKSDTIELTAKEEPKLFEFLNRLADEVGAPRPYRVFVSARVNASVFYDLSLLNFIFPAKKNLEIGLGLLNVLNLSEFKAILAHEFGHFAQKSMAIGSWVYIAHQVAAHIIAQRDILDKFIHGISRADLRIAWVGWILRLIVWSIRSLMNTLFSLVLMAERALSREMEFQSDIVAVSLTGSDALINALCKLHAADEAWERSLNFIDSEARSDRSVFDAFAIQRHIIKILCEVYDEPNYGQVPPQSTPNAEEHRVFKASLASPPIMWATHPANFDREENAKKTYVEAAIDDRSAWTIFQDRLKLCSGVTQKIMDASKLIKVDIKESIINLNKQFNKAYLSKKFRGAYLGRSITCCSNNITKLYGDYKSMKDVDGAIAKLYPKSLSSDLEKLKNLYDEKHTLEGIHAKRLNANGGIIRHRGKEIKRKELPQIIENIKDEIKEVRKIIHDHDTLCRTVHLAIAHRIGKGWEENLLGLLKLLHYADHSNANLLDIHGYIRNVVAVITADDRVSKSELKRLINTANEAYGVLLEIYDKAGQVELGRLVGKQLEIDNWGKALGEFKLVNATEENINNWMNVIDGWINTTRDSLSALSSAALEQLLKVELFLSKHYRDQTEVPDAPKAPKTPIVYSTMVEGQERDLQTTLGLWDRFYSAVGFFPAMARFVVAASIVGMTAYIGMITGGSTVTIYNGLANSVKVNIAGKSVQIPAFNYSSIELPYGKKQTVSTTINDQKVESFDIETSGGFSHYVYNVCNAMTLVEWTQIYGNASSRPDRMLGAPRWIPTSADVLFQDPPESVKTHSGGATRLVLSAVGNINPQDLLYYIKNENERQTMIRQHVIWDDPRSVYLLHWMGIAAEEIDMFPLLKERLSHYQYDIVGMRMMQDYASDDSAHDAICDEHRALAQKNPDNSNLQYLAIRCIEDENNKNLAFIQGALKWPSNAWFHLAAAYAFIEQGNWAEAEKSIELAMKYSSSFSETMAVDAMRLKRLHGKVTKKCQIDLSKKSNALSLQLRLEDGNEFADTPHRFYSLLNKGDLKAARTAINEMKGDKEHCIRLLAASNDADSDIVSEAIKLTPEQGVNTSTVWLGWCMAKKFGKDPLPYENIAMQLQRNPSIILNALTKVASIGAYTDFENDLQGMQLDERGYAYAAACLLLGDNAPDIWKDKANRLLFATERPYLQARL